MAIFIYGLEDPETGVMRYVGKAVRPDERLTAHILKSIKWSPDNEELSEWINGLLFRGKAPRIRILAETNEKDWQEKESECMAEYLNSEPRLFNKRGGGSGGPTSKLSKTERSESITITVTASQALSIRKAAATCGKSCSAFIREIVLERIRELIHGRAAK